MKRLLISVTLFLLPTLASAQCNGVFDPFTVCGNATASPGIPGMVPQAAITGVPGGVPPQIQYNNGGLFGGFTASGDATITPSTGNVVVSKFNNGTPLGSAAGANTGVSGHSVPFLDGNNVYSGNNYFGSGRPWADVHAFGAVCAGASNDTTAVQNAINAIDALGGGEVFFPPGNCNVTTTLTVAQATCLTGVNGGSATGVSSITGNADFTVVSFAANKAGGCLRNISIFGYINAAAVFPTVLVGTNSAVHMSNCVIWGGVFALRTAGVDGRIFNCYFAGWGTAGGGVDSTGANFWFGNKIDQGVVTTAFGFHQGVPTGLAENHFTGNDFSGSYSVASFSSDDGGTNRNVSIHHGSIFSSPVVLSNSRFTTIVGSEVSVSISNAVGSLSVTGSYGFSAFTITGAGARICAGNINITC